jgi:transcriptional regulator with XRE-family HTH domain
MRETRLLRGMSQSDTARGLNMSFQQIQKYETGANRISASRLYEIARLYGVPVASFFSGLDADDDKGPLDDTSAQIAREVSRIEDPRKKQHILSLIREIARTSPSAH